MNNTLKIKSHLKIRNERLEFNIVIKKGNLITFKDRLNFIFT